MSEEKEKKESGLRIVQVLASALAAVTAALLGSTLGVAGTVVGAGVASVVTTVGGELYLRSLQRTKDAALKARALATSGIRRRGEPEAPAEIPLEEQPTVQLPRPEESRPDAPWASRLRKLRWPLLIGTSVVAFAVALLMIVGVESATGGKVAGGTGESIGKIFGGGHADPTPTPTPSTTPTNDTQNSPTPSTTTETTTTPPPTTSTTPPTTTPSTTTQQPSTSATPTTTPPTSKAAPPTPTP